MNISHWLDSVLILEPLEIRPKIRKNLRSDFLALEHAYAQNSCVGVIFIMFNNFAELNLGIKSQSSHCLRIQKFILTTKSISRHSKAIFGIKILDQIILNSHE